MIANRLAELLTFHQIPITDERKILGVRTIMVRRARKTGQVQIIIVTNRQLNLTQLVKDLVKDFPEVVTVAVNTNTAKTSEIYGERQRLSGDKRVFKKVYSIMNFHYLLALSIN